MDDSWVETSLCLTMLLEITGYSLLEARERQLAGDGKGGEILKVTASMCLNSIHCHSPAGPEQSPPLQPGHTQVTVVTAPESLGERVVLNFQLCDLSGEEAQRSHGRGGENWASPAPCHRHIQKPRQHLGKWHLAGASPALKFSPALTRSPSGRPPSCVLLS